jgi:hypothetical protein
VRNLANSVIRCQKRLAEKKAINSLKNNKALRKDNINSEFLKLAGPYLATQIEKLIGST